MINNQKTISYFNKVAELTGKYDDVFLVLVTHFVSDRHYFIDALSKVAEVGIIIPKPNSINEKTFENLSNKYFIHQTRRDSIEKNPNSIISIIDKSRQSKKVIILDIGGYFSAVTAELKNILGDDLIGIIEDTENGHQKYTSSIAAHKPDINIMSVARSPLKNTEDFLVGLSICFSAEAVLREINEIFTGRSALVIGYGKIGYSIAKHLAERNITVYVHDINPLRLIEAKSHGHIVLTKEQSLKKADVVFCATGQKSIVNDDIYVLKENCVIFTSTSSDDELSVSERISDYEKIETISEHIQSLTTKKGNRYHLCNSGNAVNFLHGASVGTFIFLVQSEIMYTISVLMEMHKKKSLHKVLENSEEVQKLLAREWLDHFSSEA